MPNLRKRNNSAWFSIEPLLWSLPALAQTTSVKAQTCLETHILTYLVPFLPCVIFLASQRLIFVLKNVLGFLGLSSLQSILHTQLQDPDDTSLQNHPITFWKASKWQCHSLPHWSSGLQVTKGSHTDGDPSLNSKIGKWNDKDPLRHYFFSALPCLAWVQNEV